MTSSNYMIHAATTWSNSPPRTIAGWMSHLLLPEQLVEIRGISKKERDREAARYLATPDGLADLEQKALEWDARGLAVYWIANPLRPGVSGYAKDADVLVYRWLLLDVEPRRKTETASTAEEKALAHAMLDDLIALFQGLGVHDVATADSGNGYHLLIPFNCPNTTENKEVASQVLHGLDHRWSTEKVKIDPVTFNPSRLVRLYGTTNRKGENTEERPHRRSRFLTRPLEYSGEAGYQGCKALLARWAAQAKMLEEAREPRPQATQGSAMDRARAYLRKADPAIEGQGGSNECYRLACVLTNGYALSADEAFEAIQEWNQTCVPPWSEKELRHKIDDSIKATNHQKPRGYLLTEGRTSALDTNPGLRAAGEPRGKPHAGRTSRPCPVPKWVPFPVEHLPAVARRFVGSAAESIGCDPALVALPALVAMAGAIGNSRAISIKPGWLEPACLWGATIAGSGGHKTPAFRAAIGPLYDRQVDILEEHSAKVARYKGDLERWRDSLKKDRGERPADPGEPLVFLTSDSTIESLGEAMRGSPRGMILARDELDAWFNSFTRYSKGGSNDRPQWLEFHQAGTLLVNRVTRADGGLAVRRAICSVVGTVQPETLARAMTAEAFDSGLAARLLFAMPPRRKRVWQSAGINEEAQLAWTKLLKDLTELPLKEREKRSPHRLKFSQEGEEVFRRFFDKWSDRQFASDGHQASMLSKLEGACARLALVLHVAESYGDSREGLTQNLDRDVVDIQPEIVESAVALTKWFAREADRVCRMLVSSTESRDLVRLAEWIKGQPGGQTTASVLRKSNRSKYPDTPAAEAALDALVDAGWGDWSAPQPSRNGGRPTKFFTLKPRYPETPETDFDDDEGGEEDA